MAETKQQGAKVLNLPAPIESKTQPEFPKEVVSGIAKNFVEIYMSKSAAPLEFWYFSFLTCLGNKIANMFHLDDLSHEQPRLYTILLGESADTHKSTAGEQIIGFFEKNLPPFYVIEGCGSGQGLAAQFEAQFDGVAYGNDRSSSCLLLWYDELKMLIDITRREPVLLTFIHQLYHKNTVQNRLKKAEDSLFIEEARLSLLAASTVDTFRSIFDKAHIDLGTLNRFLLVPGRSERRMAFTSAITMDEVEFLNLYILNQLAKVQNRAVKDFPDRWERGKFKYGFSYEAREIWTHWYENEMPEGVHAKRLDNIGKRLALLLAFNDGKAEIDDETVDKVLKILHWQYRARHLCSPIKGASQAAKMEENIRQKLSVARNKILPLGVLKSQVGTAHYGLSVFNSALKRLKDAGEISINKSPNKKGKMVTYVRLRL